MNKTEIKDILREVNSIEHGETAPARVREVTRLPDGSLRRIEIEPEAYRRGQARAWKAKTEAAKVRHDLNLIQADLDGDRCFRRTTSPPLLS